VIGKFVADRETDAAGRALLVDQVDAGDFGFFAAVIGK